MTNFLKSFLREYWLWILIPFAIVIAVLVVAWVFGGGGGTSPFQYNVL